MGQHSVVGLATCYRLDGLGIESWQGEIFCTHLVWPWSPPSLQYNGYWSFPQVKWLGCGINHPPPSSTEVKESVELYLYSPSVPLWQVIGCTLPLTHEGVLLLLLLLFFFLNS